MAKRKSNVVRLRHMLDATLKALRFIKHKSRPDVDSDDQLLLALVRLIEIIGEAANKITPELQLRYKEVPWGEIIGTRNRLIHAYDEIDVDILWQIVSNDLPPLAEKLQNIISIEERNEQQNLFDNSSNSYV